LTKTKKSTAVSGHCKTTPTDNKKMEPTFRCGTRKAIDELAEELNLPNEKWMQDWPIEVMVPSDR
jgi:hypothetical protein